MAFRAQKVLGTFEKRPPVLETDKMYCFPFQLAIYSPVTAFLLLISSALVLDVAVRLRRSEEITDNQIHQDCDLFPCGNIEAAGVSLVL